MKCIIVCSRDSKGLSIQLPKNNIKKLHLDINPKAVEVYNSKITAIDSYDNALIFYNGKEYIKKIIGGFPIDFKVVGNIAYILCNESNNIIVFDFLKEQIREILPCGLNPQSMEVDGYFCFVITEMDKKLLKIDLRISSIIKEIKLDG